MSELKIKMREKLEFFRSENRETAKNECTNFMQHEYQQISTQLRNNFYQDVEALTNDLKIFEQYCFESAPKGPTRSEDIYDFCYQSLAEGAIFINKNVQNEMNYH